MAAISVQLRRFVRQIIEKDPPMVRDRLLSARAIADHIRTARADGGVANLNFICTHNARRSQFAQVWATFAAAWYKVPGVAAWSGGTEATDLDRRTIDALKRSGFQITKSEDHPEEYEVKWGDGPEYIPCYSKLYDDPRNPRSDFAAVMVCSRADQDCPFVPGTSTRISLPFNDPKDSDGTAIESAVYDACNRQIAAVMLYTFSLLREDL